MISESNTKGWNIWLISRVVYRCAARGESFVHGWLVRALCNQAWRRQQLSESSCCHHGAVGGLQADIVYASLPQNTVGEFRTNRL